jgi:hypothetical protein
VGDLRRNLEDPDPNERNQAVEGHRHLGASAREAVPALAGAFRDDELRVRK